MTQMLAAVRRTAAFFDRWDWLWLMLAAPLLLFPSATRTPALLIVPIVWLIALVAGRPLVTRTPFNLSVLLLLAMVLVSEWATYDLAQSLPKIAGLVLGVGILFAMARAGQTRRGWWLGVGLVFAVTLGMCALALLGGQWSAKLALFAPIIARLPARLAILPGTENGFSVNELAGALVWTLPLWINLAVWAWLKRMRWQSGLLLIGAGLVGATLVLTQSRGGYLGFGFGELVVLLIALPRRARRVLIGALAVLLVVGAGIAVTQPDWLASIVLGGNGAAATDAVAVIESANGRIEVWSRAIYGIQDFPFTGMGLNTFRRVVTVLYPFFLIAPDVDIAHAHNEFLQAALDLGIPGLIAFLALYVAAFAMLMRIGRNAAQTQDGLWQRAVALGLAGGLLAHIGYGMTDAVTLGAKPGLIFWLMLGLIAALYAQQCATGHRNHESHKASQSK